MNPPYGLVPPGQSATVTVKIPAGADVNRSKNPRFQILIYPGRDFPTEKENSIADFVILVLTDKKSEFEGNHRKGHREQVF